MAAGQVWRRQGAVCVPRKHDTMQEAALLPAAKRKRRILGRRSAAVPAPELCVLDQERPASAEAPLATMSRCSFSPLLTWLVLAAVLYVRGRSNNESQQAHRPSVPSRAQYQSPLRAKPGTASIHVKPRRLVPDSSWWRPTCRTPERWRMYDLAQMRSWLRSRPPL